RIREACSSELWQPVCRQALSPAASSNYPDAPCSTPQGWCRTGDRDACWVTLCYRRDAWAAHWMLWHGPGQGIGEDTSMWSVNTLTERLNLKWPILQAPMGSASTPALAAAVTNAGGLGGLGMWGRSADQAARRIAGFRQQSGGSLNVNYPIWPDPRCA